MSVKTYNHQTFSTTINGVDYTFYAYTTDTRNGFCHHIDTFSPIATSTRVSYFNRTWECFDYQTALAKAIEKFPKDVRQTLHEILVERKEKEIHEQTQKEIQTFETLYKGASESTKEKLKDVEITNESQAQAVKCMLLLDTIMHGIK